MIQYKYIVWSTIIGITITAVSAFYVSSTTPPVYNTAIEFSQKIVTDGCFESERSFRGLPLVFVTTYTNTPCPGVHIVTDDYENYIGLVGNIFFWSILSYLATVVARKAVKK